MWSGTPYVEQTGFKGKDLPTSASSLGLKVCNDHTQLCICMVLERRTQHDCEPSHDRV